MKLHRFIGGFNLKIGNLKIQDQELFNQFRNVLKLRVGEKMILSDGKMNEAKVTVKEYKKDSIDVEVEEVSINQNEPDQQVILYCSILKKENFELVVQKATEIRVKEIVPLVTARTIKLDIRKDRLEKIIKEAAEQSGRGIVPALHEPVDFEKAVASSSKTNLFFDFSGESLVNCKLKIKDSSLGVWVGPEGGWTLEEIEMGQKEGFKIVSLGKTTLRAETAAIVGSYLAVQGESLS